MKFITSDSGVSLYRDDTCLGTIKGRFVSRSLYIIFNVKVFEEDELSIVKSLIQHLKKENRDIRLLALSWKGEGEEYERLLSLSGFEFDFEKIYVKRSLKEVGPSEGERFTYKCGNEIDPVVFKGLLDRVRIADPTGDPTLSVEKEFGEVLSDLGKESSSHWAVAYLDDDPVGLVLPSVYDDEPEKGTILYIGVLDEFRGKVVGKELHAYGLKKLAQMGATEYIGSTHHENHGMVKIFQKNQCLEYGVRRYWKFSSTKFK